MKRLMILLCLLAPAGVVPASEFDLPPGKWWEDQRLAARIDLSEEQQTQIRNQVYEHARRMIDLKADVDRSGLDLANTVNNVDFNPSEVRAAHAVFQTARQKLENERFEMLLAVRQVLTAEQWGKMQEIQRRLQQMRQKRRPADRSQGGQRPQGERGPGF